MKLKDALKRAIRFCGKAKGNPLFHAVRFYPGNDGAKACLLSTDGITSIVLYVDEELPNVLLDATLLSKVVKGPGTLEIETLGYGEVLLKSGTSSFRMRTQDFEFYPTPPLLPNTFTSFPYQDAVQKVLHAAAKDKEGALLNLVHFTPDYVECTDKARLARVKIVGQWEGVVPVRLFKHWSYGDIYVAFTETHSFFWKGDELRMSVIPKMVYPNTATLVPAEHDGGRALVALEDLIYVVKTGTDVSTLSLISLEFADGQLCVRACEREGEKEVVKATAELRRHNNILGKVVLDGRLLLQALKEVDTPTVYLGYPWVEKQGQEVDPLRIESANFIACVWQRV